MINNLEKYKTDLERLSIDGTILLTSMQLEQFPKQTKEQIKREHPDHYEKLIERMPAFSSEYQNWYSEALSVIKLLLPDRLADFIRLYEKPKTRKEIHGGNYVIEDYLHGISITKGSGENVIKMVGPNAAIPKYKQQLNILNSVKKRFESSLFDIRQLVQADLFDSELESAKELAKHKFYRAAGAIAGVVLEKHFAQVCINHKINPGKKEPTINDFNELLKKEGVIDTVQWRFIQHLGDIRNLCDHNKHKEPTVDEVNDLISGSEKVIKTIF